MGSERRFWMLTALTKCGVEGSDCRVGANGRDRGHVQYAPDLGAATPDVRGTAEGSAIAIKKAPNGQGRQPVCGSVFPIPADEQAKSPTAPFRPQAPT